jgi:hypothetical protein
VVAEFEEIFRHLSLGTEEDRSQYICSKQDSNRTPPEYKSQMLLLKKTCSEITCNPVDAYRCFGGTCFLYFQARITSGGNKQ